MIGKDMMERKVPQIESIKIDKFELKYQIEGEGIPVIVIGSTLYYPRIFSQYLRQYFRFVFIDHRGFAQYSGRLELDDYTLDKIIDDIECIRTTLKLPSGIVIGHSGHGYMALEYAKKYPQAISHLVLLALSPDSSPQSFAAADRYFQESVCPERKALLAKNLTTLQAETDANPSQAFIIRALKFAPMIWYDENFDASNLWKDVTVNPEIMDYLWGSVFREIDITKNLDKLDIPVFLGLGRYDYWNPPYLWETIRSHFKDITIRVFEKSAHTPQLEEASLFDQKLLQWFQNHR
jgi:proline iminopeptidase